MSALGQHAPPHRPAVPSRLRQLHCAAAVNAAASPPPTHTHHPPPSPADPPPLPFSDPVIATGYLTASQQTHCVPSYLRQALTIAPGMQDSLLFAPVNASSGGGDGGGGSSVSAAAIAVPLAVAAAVAAGLTVWWVARRRRRRAAGSGASSVSASGSTEADAEVLRALAGAASDSAYMLDYGGKLGGGDSALQHAAGKQAPRLPRPSRRQQWK